MDYVEFGAVLKPQGIRGELKIIFSAHEDFDPQTLKTLYLKEETEFAEYSVESMRVNHGYAYVKFAGIKDRNEAELKRNVPVYAKRQDILLPEGTHYISDLVGLTVLDSEGRQLGILSEVIETGSADVYVVKDNTKGFMFPALKRVIQKIDVAAKTMTVDSKTLAEVSVDAV